MGGAARRGLTRQRTTVQAEDSIDRPRRHFAGDSVYPHRRVESVPGPSLRVLTVLDMAINLVALKQRFTELFQKERSLSKMRQQRGRADETRVEEFMNGTVAEAIRVIVQECERGGLSVDFLRDGREGEGVVITPGDDQTFNYRIFVKTGGNRPTPIAEWEWRIKERRQRGQANLLDALQVDALEEVSAYPIAEHFILAYEELIPN
jgi:hypothetical protein